ncbi:hypothetical protein [Shewanella sp. 10N.286.52.B9]|uniref:hypothetical protein n=1 Tax=Shewanella sp. 10N.286.52.B9 TaxID=1880837 RepID=UPI000C84A1F9|nr:hypothetical protein [Shewanella sp. 10N.286.52.B9]PMG40090.1 hypothetical protein BCU91_13930 [Shewanella sp. 10N.286.52.B9]
MNNVFNTSIGKTAQTCLLGSMLTLSMASMTYVAPTAAASIGNQGRYFTNKVTGATETVTLSGSAAVQTRALQAAIDRATNKPNGGVVKVMGNDLKLAQVDLKANVRLEIQSGKTIKMADKVLFNLNRNGQGPRAPLMQNVEITSTGNARFKIDVNKNAIFLNAIPVRVGYVKNFALSNFDIKDNYSIFPSLFMVADSDARTVANNATYGRIPQKGVVENISATKVAAGYALIQLFSGKQMRLKNLDAEGGLTIRLEPGSGRPSDYLNQAGPRVGNIADIKMIDIENTEGMAALFLKPHQKICSDITGTNIRGVNSAFTIMSNSSDSSTFSRGYFERTKFTGRISLTKTKNTPLADIGASSQYFVEPSESAGRTKIADFPNDPSGRRWHTKPIAPVLLASALNKNNVGTAVKGRFGIDISNANITKTGNYERATKVFYREDAVKLNDKAATVWINK